MPLFKTALRFAHDTTWPSRRKWTTTFFQTADNPAVAADLMLEAWADLLRPAVASDIFCYEVYCTDTAEGTDNYTVVSVSPGSQRGTFNNTGAGERYLPQAVVTITLAVANSRPSRKFWRFGLREGNINNGEGLSTDVLTEVTDAFSSFIGAPGLGLCDPDGQPLVSVAKLRLGTREFGRTAGADVPQPPAVG